MATDLLVNSIGGYPCDSDQMDKWSLGSLPACKADSGASRFDVSHLAGLWGNRLSQAVCPSTFSR